MGGAKSNVRQHWEMASNDYNLTYDWRSSTYDKSKLTLTKNGKNCWTLRKPSGEDYSISYKNFSLCFNGGWKEKDTFLILMHFTKDDVGNYRYQAFKEAFGEHWTTNTMICDTAGNSHGNRRLVNYNDERHELTWMIQLTAFSGVIAFYYNFWGVDQVTIAALSENDYNRLLQVPYGYDHLKPISVGDKLGLVYWDGVFTEEGKAIAVQMTTDNPDWQFVYLSKADYWARGLGVVKDGGTPHKRLLEGAGTINLTDYGFTLKDDNGTFKSHVFHVI